MANMQRSWWVRLTAVLCLYYVIIGVQAGGSTAVVAILGVVCMGAALVMRARSRPAASCLLAIGALPLGIVLWWSLITPIIAVLALICGGLAISACRRPATLRV